MQFKRILAIGDVHGNYERLTSVYAKIDHNPAEDALILLGDYVDRGPESVKCLDWVMAKVKEPNVTALRGNHERMMLDFYDGLDDSGLWLMNGGNETYKQLAMVDDRDAYLKFARRLPTSLRLGNFVFAHAGVNPRRAVDDQVEDDLVWIRDEFFANYVGSETIVVGHTPVQALNRSASTPIFAKNGVIFVDTGSYLRDGHVSCVDVLTHTFWQSD